MALAGHEKIDLGALSGGCQCGAVRYSVAAGPAVPLVCACRMCQRATGGVMAAFLEVEAERVRWTGTAATFASSSEAERGFCSACGTSLFYRRPGRASVELMMGAIDGGAPVEPRSYYYPESAPDWLHGLEAVPVKTNSFEGAQMMSRQTTKGS